MRLVTYEHDGARSGGLLIGERIVALPELGAPADSVRGVLEALEGDELLALGERAAVSSAGIELARVTLLAPVPDPEKIICLGLNYRDHAAETGQEAPAAPMWFAKFANSLIGSGGEIVLPRAHPDHVDYEAELAIVIGRTARNVEAQDALHHIAGAMPFNDVSARDLQMQNPLWTSGKALDTFAPCGPALVTLDEIEDLQGLSLCTRIDGELVQQGSTADQIFTVAETVAWLSRTLTLRPGDIIATGTPAGVGASKGRFLHAGENVEVEIAGVGLLSNPVRGE